MQQPALLALSLHFPREQQSRRQPALGRGHRRGSAPTTFLLAGMVLCPPRGRVSQETAPESSSDTFPASRATLFGLSPRHTDGSTRPLLSAMCQERFLTVPQSPDSLRKASSGSLLPPATSSRSRGRGKPALAENTFLLPSPRQRFLPPPLPSLRVPTLPRAAPGSARPQISLPHTVEPAGRTHKSKSKEKNAARASTARPPSLPPRTPRCPPSRSLTPVPPTALLPPRVGNCSDALSAAAASSLPSSLFPRAEETSHSCTFIFSQVETLSPWLPPGFWGGSRDTQHPPFLLRAACPGLAEERVLSREAAPAARRMPSAEHHIRQAHGHRLPGKFPSPHVRRALRSAAKGDEFPLSAR